MPNVQGVFTGCEADGLQEYLKYGVEQKMEVENYHFHITPLSHRYQAKLDRIRALFPIYRSGTIRHKRGECSTLENELKWLGSIHPDAADAMAYQPEMWVAPSLPDVDEVGPLEEWLKGCMNDTNDKKTDWYNNPYAHQLK